MLGDIYLRMQKKRIRKRVKRNWHMNERKINLFIFLLEWDCVQFAYSGRLLTITLSCMILGYLTNIHYYWFDDIFQSRISKKYSNFGILWYILNCMSIERKDCLVQMYKVTEISSTCHHIYIVIYILAHTQ